ncbi:LA_2272/LA_2273 family lipoprotein [Leptospira ainazelensis]|uniref:LA_2272/LA_2273 family lipoprotein n=1 Tax=Leptospira ainazelensis TaxID=2810034 RepID=UPI001E4A2E96|nr:hypothetical protein [Leptospira ainazelensis]
MNRIEHNPNLKSRFGTILFFFRPKFLFLFLVSTLVTACGVALVPRLTVKIPPKTETEVFRLNLLYGKVDSIYGINLGIINSTDRLIGAQVGIVNFAENSIGVQVGIINNSQPTYGTLKIGLLNVTLILSGLDPNNKNRKLPEKDIGISVGVFNLMSGKFNFGLYNWGKGGLNLGLLNNNAGNSVNIGVLNLIDNTLSISVHNNDKSAISLGLVNVGGRRNELQIGIINYCPNNTVPIMIFANYCADSKATEKSETIIEPTEKETFEN